MPGREPSFQCDEVGVVIIQRLLWQGPEDGVGDHPVAVDGCGPVAAVELLLLLAQRIVDRPQHLDRPPQASCGHAAVEQELVAGLATSSHSRPISRLAWTARSGEWAHASAIVASTTVQPWIGGGSGSPVLIA